MPVFLCPVAGARPSHPGPPVDRIGRHGYCPHVLTADTHHGLRLRRLLGWGRRRNRDFHPIALLRRPPVSPRSLSWPSRGLADRCGLRRLGRARSLNFYPRVAYGRGLRDVLGISAVRLVSFEVCILGIRLQEIKGQYVTLSCREV